MKAAVYSQYGPPGVVTIAEIPQPIPKPNELLIKVFSSTVTRTDSGFRSAEYFVSRFFSGLLRPKFPVLGCEFAGVVEETGSSVTSFKKGDRVFGFNDQKFGGHAEFLTLAETDAVDIILDELSFDEAAALTEGSHYALVDIRAAKTKPGQNVLVYGATGAIGSAAVQLLKYFQTNVTAVCGSAHVGLVKSLGADVVIDYQSQDFTKTDLKYDFIFDAVGKSSFGVCKQLLTSKGIYISTELGKNGENILYALTTPIFGGKKLLFPLPTITKSDVVFIRELVLKEFFKPVIDRKYPLNQIVEAYKYVDSGQKIGNVILKIRD